jgi:hypothetical protein
MFLMCIIIIIGCCVVCWWNYSNELTVFVDELVVVWGWVFDLIFFFVLNCGYIFHIYFRFNASCAK